MTRPSSTANGAPQRPDGAAMRAALVAAALEVLRDEGAAALTVRRVTTLAGCSTTGVYTWFGGKHGLVEAIFLEGFEAFDQALVPHYEAGDLLGAGRAYRRWALENPMHYMVMFGRAVPDFEPSADALLRASRSFEHLAAAISAVSDDPDPLWRAYQAFATVHGHVMLEMAGMNPPNGPDPADAYERALLDLVADR